MNIIAILILIIPLAISSAVPASESLPAIKARLEAALKLPSRAYSFSSKSELHAHIKAVAKLYNLPSRLLKRIVAVESANCKYRVNKRTKDFGCAQINHLTIKGYNWNADSVMHNDRLNIVAAAVVLSDLKKVFGSKEPNTWSCRYNIGWRKLPKACSAYLNKLSLVSL